MTPRGPIGREQAGPPASHPDGALGGCPSQVWAILTGRPRQDRPSPRRCTRSVLRRPSRRCRPGAPAGRTTQAEGITAGAFSIPLRPEGPTRLDREIRVGVLPEGPTGPDGEPLDGGYAQPAVAAVRFSGLRVVGRDSLERDSGRPWEFLGALMTPRGPIGREQAGSPAGHPDGALGGCPSQGQAILTGRPRQDRPSRGAA